MAKLGLLLAVLASVLALIVLVLIQVPDGKLHLYFLDVGQGDSILINTPGNYQILIDGGPNSRVLGQLSRVMPFWDRQIDLVVGTHPDSDHTNGLNSVLASYQVKQIWLPDFESPGENYQKLLEGIKREQITPVAPIQGDELVTEDGVKIKVLWPKQKKPLVPTTNQGSVVLLLEYQNYKVLLTGDAESSVQPYGGFEDDIHILKVPHHGSKNGFKEGYLSSLKPDIAIVSAGKNNRYGHPDPGILAQLSEAGSQIFQTASSGRIEVVMTSESWYTRTER
jgi:competence protein ComEC